MGGNLSANILFTLSRRKRKHAPDIKRSRKESVAILSSFLIERSVKSAKRKSLAKITQRSRRLSRLALNTKEVKDL